MRTTRFGCAPLIALSIVASTFAGRTEAASFSFMGTLPGGKNGLAYGVSGNGRVAVGQADRDSGTTVAVRRVDGVVTELGDFGSFLPFETWGASFSGRVVAGRGSGDRGWEAFRVDDGELTRLGTLEDHFSSAAMGVNTDGSVVVGWSDGGSKSEAFRWTPEHGMVGLGEFDFGGGARAAYGVSADGAVIVGEGSSTRGQGETQVREAFRWTAETGLEALGWLNEATPSSTARDVSADGRVIVGSSYNGQGSEAFRWVEGEMTGLGDLEGGAFDSFAAAVSGDGAIIVGTSATDNADGYYQDAFIWDAEHGMRNLKSLFEDEFGLDLSSWELTHATGISDDGRTIVGLGVDLDSGGTRGWVAEIPEPSTFTLIAAIAFVRRICRG